MCHGIPRSRSRTDATLVSKWSFTVAKHGSDRICSVSKDRCDAGSCVYLNSGIQFLSNRDIPIVRRTVIHVGGRLFTPGDGYSRQGTVIHDGGRFVYLI